MNTVGLVRRIETERLFRILDRASLQKVPGFCSMATRMDRLILRFLRQFAKLIIQPVERNDRVNVDYIPTQVFTEFLRDFEFDGGCIDGLRYRSATGEKGTNYVLFANQSDVFDAVTPEPSEQSNPWLRLVGVKQMRI
ncbi:RES family NAD+ phosphorylase [Neorhizobium galegae]|uniref:RES family NAD+ phosphorylase n=1 Tax=Neorhizobium galegae TaxID=399 RepID=UPI002106FA9A|nr:RES family NAD+ phosphorylase [Neorhizobium galegae]MCQ1856220.1 RES family NAD+ phosphorylase [Neorhizobium galegae]